MARKMKTLLIKWRQDYAFRTMTGSLLSFGINTLFALYNGFLGIRLSSVWHGSICVFYLLLVMIRGIILLTERTSRAKSEAERAYAIQKTLLLTAGMLLLLNLALILPITLMVVLEKPVNMGLIPAIAMAAYTTYKITMASIHIRRQKHGGHPLVAELRTINFIDALVSILTLQNTLIMVNQTKSEDGDMLALSAVSSTVIYLVIVSITVRLFVKGFRAVKSEASAVTRGR